jgi:two-component system cell cycle sensor histidine kinase/response regulator CckA
MVSRQGPEFAYMPPITLEEYRVWVDRHGLAREAGRPTQLRDRDAGELSAGARDFFEMSLDNLSVAGFDGYLKRVNPSWTRTLGWSAEELMSRPSVEFVHPEDREATLTGRQRLKTGSELGPLVNRYICKDGTYRWFEWRSVADVERGLVYAAARDVTEQKRTDERLAQAKELQEKLQQQLIFANRMASVGTLAAGVAHEINNPLSFVAANIAMIIEGLETLGDEHSPQRIKELNEMALDVQVGAERIRKIVRGLKTFSRAEKEQLAVIGVIPVLELAINMTFNEFRHRARLVKDYGKLPLVEADEARLGQVFINLLVNAAQAIPEGDRHTNEIRIVTSTDAAGRAVIEVRDTGVGIPAQLLDRVFDPFFTTKPVGIGTGLGLSICHNIVTGMGGEITVASEEGRGTTIRVVLNAAAAVTTQTAAPATAPEEAIVCAAILVVDDEPSIGIVLRRVLREHQVTAVTTAKEALELLTAGKHFDVVLSDLMMPKMSGMDFYEEVARRFPALAGRVVFISGGAFTPAAAAFLDRISNERIEKPFDPRRVREIVQRLVGSRSSSTTVA